MIQGTYPRGENRFQLIYLDDEILSNPRTVIHELNENQTNIFFVTSTFMEDNLILEILVPPIRYKWSIVLANQDYLAKIFVCADASVYYFLS